MPTTNYMVIYRCCLRYHWSNRYCGTIVSGEHMYERGDFAEWVPRWSTVKLGRVDAESEVLVLGQTSCKF